MLCPRLAHVFHVGGKAQHLRLTLAFHFNADRHEWRIVDGDADLFHRGNQEIGIAVATNDGGEQPHHGFAANGRAQVVPGAITGDAHVDIAAEIRVPQVDRRQALVAAFGDLREQIARLARVCHALSFTDSTPANAVRIPAWGARASPRAYCRITSENRRDCGCARYPPESVYWFRSASPAPRWYRRPGDPAPPDRSTPLRYQYGHRHRQSACTANSWRPPHGPRSTPHPTRLEPW